MRKILVTYAHPEYPPSRVNRALRQGAQALLASRGLEVTWHDLYRKYPDFMIRIGQEQALLQAHEVLVFQHPLFWYSVPALLKHWIDEVLTEGWAYGGKSRALAGKTWVHWLTAGGSASAYSRDEANGFGIQHLLRPLERTALLCDCRWLPPQVTHASLTLTDEDLAAEGQRYGQWLARLVAAEDGDG